LLESAALVREDLLQSLHDLGHQSVSVLHGLAGLVDEARLNLTPTTLKALGFGTLEERFASFSVRGVDSLALNRAFVGRGSREIGGAQLRFARQRVWCFRGWGRR
jgi:hypothetical protein